MLSVCYLLIAHVPIWLVTKWQHLPHDNSKAPDITSWGEDPMSNSLWSCPSDGNLTTLWQSRDIVYPACMLEVYFSSVFMQGAYKVVQSLCPPHLKWLVSIPGEISKQERSILGKFMSLSSVWMLHKITAMAVRAWHQPLETLELLLKQTCRRRCSKPLVTAGLSSKLDLGNRVQKVRPLILLLILKLQSLWIA